jgi:YD repeat-containing protein
LTSDWVDGNHPATLASNFVYNAAGALTQVDFGNGTRLTRTFNSGLQLKTLRQGTPGAPGSLLSLEYNHQETVSNNGRIMSGGSRGQCSVRRSWFAGYVRYRLPTIIQGSQTRWQRVDSFGRVKEDQQAESGLTSFTYDDAGRVVTKTDSRGIVTTTYYDEINRPTGVTFSDGTPGITYTYDTGSYGIGRPAAVTNGVATSAYTYNNLGQVIREDKTINGVPFHTTHGYNLAGQVTTARLPNGTILTNNYDTVGHLASLTSDWVDGNHPAMVE